MSFALRPLYPRLINSRYQLDAWMGGSKFRYERCGIRKKILILSGIEPRPSSPWLCLMSYPGFFKDSYRSIFLIYQMVFLSFSCWAVVIFYATSWTWRRRQCVPPKRWWTLPNYEASNILCIMVTAVWTPDLLITIGPILRTSAYHLVASKTFHCLY